MKEMIIQGNSELIMILTMMIADYDKTKGDMTMDRVLELPQVVLDIDEEGGDGLYPSGNTDPMLLNLLRKT